MVTARGRQLTSGHRDAQSRLGDIAKSSLVGAWFTYLSDLDVNRWLSTLTGGMIAYHAESALIGRNYYRLFSIAETGGRYNPTAISGLSVTARQRQRLIAAGPDTLRNLLRAGVPAAEAVETAGNKALAIVEEIILDGGRSQILTSVLDDNRTFGWYRVTRSLRPCAFCSLMASRGAVYKSQMTAMLSSANNPFGPHPNCKCQPMPAYTPDRFHDERTEYWDWVYQRVTRGQLDPLNAWRRYWERPHLHEELLGG